MWNKRIHSREVRIYGRDERKENSAEKKKLVYDKVSTKVSANPVGNFGAETVLQISK